MGEETCEFEDEMSSSDYRCDLVWLAYAFRGIQLHYITAAILAIIIFISIFGKIKANYRWFVLNQAIWDACLSYDFFCNNYFFAQPKCFYRIFLSYPTWKIVLFNAMNRIFLNNYYVAFFLLTFSRFLCLYFNGFYERTTKGLRVLFLIASIMMIFFSITIIFSTLESVTSAISLDATNQCKKLNATNDVKQHCKSELLDASFGYNFYRVTLQVLDKIETLKGLLCVTGALIATFLIIRKVSRQFKFQYNNNRKDFYGSFRIAAVLTIQLFFNVLMLLLESSEKIYSLIVPDADDRDLFYSPWSYGNVQTFRQIRIFLECVIILTIMTGYREAIIKLFKWITRKVKSQPIYSSSVSMLTRSAHSGGVIFSNQR